MRCDMDIEGIKMNASELLVYLTLCALLGATGQAARAVVGIKKMSDVAGQEGKSPWDCFSPSQLIVSLIIGGVAGVIAGLTLMPATGAAKIEGANFAIGIMGSGYAGADFIEGFVQKERLGQQKTADASNAQAQAPSEIPPVG